ncbi:MAG: DUF393 domain-containing protein [Lysinibacillus sp.]|nr:DUF393 domain-containing protein [Lysinibacillus sp.]
MKSIILFDGDCSFCNRSVQFIIKRDPKKVFQFASLQSEIGIHLKHLHQVPNQLDSMILIEGDKYYIKSTAALRICKNLKGFWKVFYLLIIVPKPIRHKVYDFIAKYRYLFNKNDVCMLPSPSDLDRFLS